MAARINKKRSFLFVSRVLGKHIPIQPQKGLLTAALLAARYGEKVKGVDYHNKSEMISSFKDANSKFETSSFLPENIHPVVIGFAETATALGHAFFDCFRAGEYFHTTREELSSIKPSVTFEEEHSHATSHLCYIPIEMLDNDREIILVDDEMTTGKTALNIIRSIHSQFPRKQYTVAAILDWRSEENKQKFLQLEKQLGIKIHTVSLLAGEVEINQQSDLEETRKAVGDIMADMSIEEISLSPFFKSTSLSTRILKQSPFITETGRFGINCAENTILHEKILEASKILKQKRSGTKTLCLGTGEFMYIPMKLAAELGENVYYHSTTRSPIHIFNQVEYGVRHGITFPNPEDLSVTHFVYNIPPGEFDELFLFFERKPAEEDLKPLLKQLEPLLIRSIKIVFFSGTVRGCIIK